MYKDDVMLIKRASKKSRLGFRRAGRPATPVARAGGDL